MTDRASEFRRGLGRTSRYLLSHHTPREYHKCYHFRIRGRSVRLCARCLGVYSGILVGAVTSLSTGVNEDHAWIVVGVLPIFAIAHWSFINFTERRGNNLVRTATGLLLGFGYITGVSLLLQGSEIPLVSGVLYGSAAAALLYLRQKKRPDS